MYYDFRLLISSKRAHTCNNTLCHTDVMNFMSEISLMVNGTAARIYSMVRHAPCICVSPSDDIML